MTSPSGEEDDINLDFLPKEKADKLKKMFNPEFFTPTILRHLTELNLADELLKRQTTESILAAPLMQVLSITLHMNEDDGNPFEVYGTVLIDDGEGTSSPIYNRGATEPQRMRNGGRLMLSIPKGYRAITPSDEVDIEITLSGKIPKMSDDKIGDIVAASHRWNFRKFGGYDIPLQWRINGEHGYVIVDYVVYRHAISVTIDAMLLKGNEEDNKRVDIPHVYGTISARCGNNCSTYLFEKEESESVMVEYGACIELSRAVVVAPVWGPLVIQASLWKRNPAKMIADGQPHDFDVVVGCERRMIKGENDIIEAQLRWKPAYWEPIAESNKLDLFPLVKRPRITPDQQLAETIKRNLRSNLRTSMEQTDRAQLEVFSVSVHNRSKDNFRVWGSIETEYNNYQFKHIFFRREKTNAERLLNNQTLPIMFPPKCIKDWLFSINLDLKDDNDCVVSYGGIFWIPEDFKTDFWYNRKLCSVNRGDDGYYAAVYYSIFNGGLEANVKIYLIDKRATMKCTKVYGSVRSQYSSFKYMTIDDNELYTRKLYVRSIEDSSLRFAQSKILLSESSVSVPVASALFIDVDLNVNSWGVDFPPTNCSNETLRAIAEHVEFRAVFSTEHQVEHWVSDDVNFGHQIQVSVEWKRC